MARTRDWLLRADGALCLDGYPIRIRRDGQTSFLLEQDGHEPVSYDTIDLALRDGGLKADELDTLML